jgi:hypothetical protein
MLDDSNATAPPLCCAVLLLSTVTVMDTFATAATAPPLPPAVFPLKVESVIVTSPMLSVHSTAGADELAAGVRPALR